MATKEAAVYNFLSSFGIPAYTSASVPSDAEFPYLTYDLTVGSFESGEVPLTVNLWYRGMSESAPNAKAREVSERVGMGGTTLKCDGGMIWVKRGTPWCQSIADTDDTVKRRYINLSVEYMTLD